MSKSSKEIIAPIVVLACICLVASFLLAGVFQITDPIIQANAAETASKARVAVLPEANAFKAIDADLVNGVTDIYAAENGAGYVCSTKVKGMEAGLKLMIGINSKGEISGISVLEHSETKGIGTKVLDPTNLERYKGAKAASDVDGITGATYTSKGVAAAVTAAFAQYEAVK